MYYVYVLTNYKKTVLYIGLTGNLIQRVEQHKSFQIEGFTKQYRVGSLIYYEQFENVEDAKKREKAMKKWNRQWKEELINDVNPKWDEIIIM